MNAFVDVSPTAGAAAVAAAGCCVRFFERDVKRDVKKDHGPALATDEREKEKAELEAYDSPWRLSDSYSPEVDVAAGAEAATVLLGMGTT